MENCIQRHASRVIPTLPPAIPTDLPASVLALFKLPVPVTQISALCQMFPGKDMVIHQSGDWIVISRKGAQP